MINGGANIFSEIKKLRGKCTTLSSRIDDEVGQKNIASHFAHIYSELYNRVDLSEKLESVSNKLQAGINQDSAAQLDRINVTTVEEALKLMKGNKHDALFDIVSDLFINGPPELSVHLTNLVRLYISHGSVPYFVLLCTLMPLVKDNLADITASSNYRAIAGGSLLLKLLDIVILQL